MANSAQARKRVRQTEVRTERNQMKRSRMRTQVKKLEKAIEAGDKTAIGASFTAAMSELQKAAGKGLIKKQTAARKISRLASRIRSLGA